jgi:hypothetical protein
MFFSSEIIIEIISQLEKAKEVLGKKNKKILNRFTCLPASEKCTLSSKFIFWSLAPHLYPKLFLTFFQD